MEFRSEPQTNKSESQVNELLLRSTMKAIRMHVTGGLKGAAKLSLLRRGLGYSMTESPMT